MGYNVLLIGIRIENEKSLSYLSYLIYCYRVIGLYADSDHALFNLDLGDTFGGADSSVNRIGNQDLIFMGFTLGVVLDSNHLLLLYVTKGGAVTQTGSVSTPTPSSYVVGHEQIGYEYIFETNSAIDVGLSAELGSFIVSDGNSSSGVSMAADITLHMVINLTENLKLQLGYGKRFSKLEDADLVGMSLRKDQVDTDYYSLRLDVGLF